MRGVRVVRDHVGVDGSRASQVLGYFDRERNWPAGVQEPTIGAE